MIGQYYSSWLFISGESYGELNGYGSQPVKRRNPISKLMNNEPAPRPRIQINLLEDFRRVSAIIDVDIVPETHRRVKLMKNGSDKPLGFYIRDGTSVRVTPQGLEKVCFGWGWGRRGDLVPKFTGKCRFRTFLLLSNSYSRSNNVSNYI